MIENEIKQSINNRFVTCLPSIFNDNDELKMFYSERSVHDGRAGENDQVVVYGTVNTILNIEVPVPVSENDYEELYMSFMNNPELIKTDQSGVCARIQFPLKIESLASSEASCDKWTIKIEYLLEEPFAGQRPKVYYSYAPYVGWRHIDNYKEIL